MLKLKVVTRDIRNPDDCVTKVIDHDDRSDRVWLGKHCFWAFRSGYSVTTYAASEDAD